MKKCQQYAYTSLAMIYDLFMEDIPYEKMVEQLQALWQKQNCEVKTVLDAGCGTGAFTLPLAKAGYETCGVDISNEMLTMADQKAFAQNVSCLWIEADLCTLNFAPQFDSVISFFDTFNYILEAKDLLRVFQNLHQCLFAGGCLVFDMRTPFYYQKVLDAHMFRDEKKGICLFWDNHYIDADIYMDLDFFVPKEKGLYLRYQEQHVQHAYGIPEILDFLKKAGFNKIGIASSLGGNWHWLKNEYASHIRNTDLEKMEDKERVFFYAQK